MAVVEGIDVSNNQGPINWRSVASSGKRLAFIKASEGTFFQDAYFHSHYAHAMQMEMWRGAYHFARPGRGPSGADEANYFCDYVLRSPQIAGDLYALDLEQDRSQPAPGTDLGAYTLDFCQTVVARTGVKPVIYSTTGMLQSWKCDIEALADYGLWLAAPGARRVPAPPSHWDVTAFWQYNWHGRVPGVTGDCDLTRFMGTAEQLAAYGAAA